MAKQAKRICGQTQEYPGSYIWYDYEVFCPSCENWVQEYGEVDEQDKDGDWHMLCIDCGNQEDNECQGHPAGEFDSMGETVYCDDSCRKETQMTEELYELHYNDMVCVRRNTSDGKTFWRVKYWGGYEPALFPFPEAQKIVTSLNKRLKSEVAIVKH